MSETRSTTVLGAASAASAYALWGLFPLYFKAVAHVPAVEVLAHRIVWTLVLMAGVIALLRHWRRVAAVFTNRRLAGGLVLAAAVITVNWGVFIWAIAVGRVLESSLGYFINPLVSVVLGVVVLSERLRPLQWGAVALAAAGVGYQVVAVGVFPWVSLTLAVTFGVYGLIRKVITVDPTTGLFVETLVLAPVAAGYLVILAADGSGSMGPADWTTTALLLVSGPLTALPLLLFVTGAQRIRLSTLGLLQYIVPTGHFLLAVFAFGEAFTVHTLITFACVWAALGLYAVSAR